MKKRMTIVNYLPLVIAIAAVFAVSTARIEGQRQIQHFVSVGGPDVEDPDLEGSGPGFDKNLSLTAFLYADGTAAGILVDRWGTPGTIYRATLDCVYVEANNAWVSGVVTQGVSVDENGDTLDVTGWYVRMRVQDNGPNNDPANPDRIGISVFRTDQPWICSERRGAAFDMPRGQAIVR